MFDEPGTSTALIIIASTALIWLAPELGVLSASRVRLQKQFELPIKARKCGRFAKFKVLVIAFTVSPSASSPFALALASLALSCSTASNESPQSDPTSEVRQSASPVVPVSPREGALARAKSAVGYSYWWGRAKWLPEAATDATRGSCVGDCPSCTHTGDYGADCSGFVAKVWQVPPSNTDISVDSHPFATFHFVRDSALWSTIAPTEIRSGDAMVQYDGASGHIFIYESHDAWGSVYAYECKGCAFGCVYNLRTVTSAFHAIRRAGW